MPIYVRGKLRVLHVHIPKTGGDFLRNVLLDNGFTCLPETYSSVRSMREGSGLCSRQHYHRDLILSEYPSGWTHSVAIVRNPLARFLSEYRFRVHRSDGRLGKLRRLTPLGCWARQSFRKYRKNPFLFDNHLRPQVGFLVPGMDVVWKIEWGFEVLLEHLSEQGLQLEINRPPRNVTRKKDAERIPSWLSERLRDLYREDFEQLGYGREGEVLDSPDEPVYGVGRLAPAANDGSIQTKT